MTKIDELAFLDAVALAELVRRKEVRPIELVEATIERIERLNPTLNAVVTPMYDEARRVAQSDLPAGPFTGVPYFLKDVLARYGGVRQTSGCVALRNSIAASDTEFVARLKRAGLIVVAKTNVPEFGILPTTEPKLFGATHNPWDTSRTPGGSSGGSAAAVVSGLVPMAHSNDGAGSIRIPASCCGVFGLKPTRGRNPLGPDTGDIMNGLVIEHAVTRTVRDSAALLDATSGPDVGDPYWAPPPARPFSEEVGTPPGRLRIAFTSVPLNGVPVHPDCVAAVEGTAKLCADLGHEVVEDSPKIDGRALIESFLVLWSANYASTVSAVCQNLGMAPTTENFEILTLGLYEMGLKHSAVDYIHAVSTLQRAGREMGRFLTGFDLWLTPTIAEPPVPLGTFDSPADDPLKGLYRAFDFMPFTPICNATGQPAMSVPLYWNGAGLPVGTHFIARLGDEANLFRLAGQLEQARPWAGRRPPVSA